VRRPIVEATSMKTAATRTPKTKRNAKPIARESTTASALGGGWSSSNERAAGGRGREEHRHEEDAASEHDGSKEAIFLRAEVARDRGDEPEEGDTGKRDHVQADYGNLDALVVEVEVRDLLRARSR